MELPSDGFDFESRLRERDAEAVLRSSPSVAKQGSNKQDQAHQPNFRKMGQETVCKFWLKGACVLGDQCGFLHEFDAERIPVCNTLLKHGICKEPACPFKHSLDDIKECNMFKLGFCVHGPLCRFKHTRLAFPAPEPKDIDCSQLKDISGRQKQVNEGKLKYKRKNLQRKRLDGPRSPPGSTPQHLHQPRKKGRDDLNNSGPTSNMMWSMSNNIPTLMMPGMMPGMMNAFAANPYWWGNAMFMPNQFRV